MKWIHLNELPETGVSHNARIRKRMMLEKGDADPIVTYGRAVFPPGEMAGAHCHDDLTEVFTVESGEGEIRVDGEAYPFGAGTTAVVEPGEVHELINTGCAALVVTYFSVLAR